MVSAVTPLPRYSTLKSKALPPQWILLWCRKSTDVSPFHTKSMTVRQRTNQPKLLIYGQKTIHSVPVLHELNSNYTVIDIIHETLKQTIYAK